MPPRVRDSGARLRMIARNRTRKRIRRYPTALRQRPLVRRDAVCPAAAATVAACCITSSPSRSSPTPRPIRSTRSREALNALAATLPEVRSLAVGKRSRPARGQRELRDRRAVRRRRRVQGLRRSPRAHPRDQGADRPEHHRAPPGAVHGLTRRSSEPSGAPRSAASACSRKSPCSTTPVTALTACGERGADRRPRGARSRGCRWPSSVTNGRAVAGGAQHGVVEQVEQPQRACPASRSARPRPAAASARRGGRRACAPRRRSRSARPTRSRASRAAARRRRP